MAATVVTVACLAMVATAVTAGCQATAAATATTRRRAAADTAAWAETAAVAMAVVEELPRHRSPSSPAASLTPTPTKGMFGEQRRNSKPRSVRENHKSRGGAQRPRGFFANWEFPVFERAI